MSFRDQIQECIDKYGHQIIGVGGNGHPSFSYTIGLTATFGYELLCCGLPAHIAHAVLNDIASKGTVELDVPNDDFTNLPVMFKLCKDTDALHDKYVCQADNFYGKRVKVVQVVLSDAAGNLPHQEGFDLEYMGKRQPLLY
jgi:Domain of unknown function (DUF4262)